MTTTANQSHKTTDTPAFVLPSGSRGPFAELTRVDSPEFDDLETLVVEQEAPVYASTGTQTSYST